MCGCDVGYTCPRCQEPSDLAYEDRERDEKARYDAANAPETPREPDHA